MADSDELTNAAVASGSGNVIAGTAGADRLNGTAAADAMDGGEGDDIIYAGEGEDTVHGGGGRDTLLGGAGDDTLHGGDGNDVFFGDGSPWGSWEATNEDAARGGNDRMFGGAGNDTFYIGAGEDHIDGGEGVDTLRLSGPREAYRFIREGEGVRIVGSDGDDFAVNVEKAIFAGDWRNAVALEDLIEEPVAEAPLPAPDETGSTGEPAPAEEPAPAAADEEAPADEPAPVVDPSLVIAGTAGADRLNGTAAADAMDGGEGDDIIYAGEGDDTVHGGGGRDTLLGGAGDDTLHGGDGNDVFFGDGSPWGSWEATNEDAARGGNDRMFGGAGNDTFFIGAGEDHIDGGEGVDTLRLSGPREAYRFIREGEGVRIVGSDGDDFAVNVEKAIFAGDWRNPVALEDLVEEPVAEAPLPAPDETGSTGEPAPAEEPAPAAADEEAPADEPAPVVDPSLVIAGTAGADRLNGTAAADAMDGGEGDDIIYAGEGDDTVHGGGGRDTLLGGAGDDTLLGGDGNDVFFGDGSPWGSWEATNEDAARGGNDRMFGGAGNDTFYIGAGEDHIDGGEGVDTLRLSGPREAYRFIREGEGVRIVGSDGDDFAVNVEKAIFAGDWRNPVALEDLIEEPVAEAPLPAPDETGSTGGGTVPDPVPGDVPGFVPSGGMNLAGVSYWGTEFAFIDLMKTGRSWGAGTATSWRALEASDLEAGGYLDDRGWPTAMPEGVTRVFTALLSGVPAENVSMAGRYHVRYEGEGRVDVYGRDAAIEVVSRHDGEIVFDYTPTGRGIVYVEILDTDPSGTGDYIRDLSVVKEEHLDLYDAGARFNPDWIAHIGDLRSVRFMDWMRTNASAQSEWSERPVADEYSYGTDKGVPLEVMVDLANEIGADPWFTIPFHATDEYVREFATYVRDHLDPGLRARIEYSNEVWNNQFRQTHDADAAGRALFGDTYGEWPRGVYYGYRSAQIMEIFHEVFGAGAAARVEGVLGMQTGAVWGLENRILEGVRLHAEAGGSAATDLFGSLAVTWYFGHGFGSNDGYARIKAWEAEGGTAHAIDNIFAQLLGGGLTDIGHTTIAQTIGLIQASAEAAARAGLGLVSYEGGAHIAPAPGPREDAAFVDLLIAVNRDPRMVEVYEAMHEAWIEAGGGLFTAFLDVGRPGKYGSWGHLEHLDDESARWDAIMAFNETMNPNLDDRDASAFDRGVTLFGTAASEALTGTGEEDYLIGGGGDDALAGGNGNDGLSGGAGNDLLDGGDGDDTLNGGSGDDIILAGNGNDTIVAGDGNDTIDGGNGYDTLVMESFAARYLLGLGDNDTLTLQIGDSRMEIRNVEALRSTDERAVISVADLTHEVQAIEDAGGVAYLDEVYSGLIQDDLVM